MALPSPLPGLLPASFRGVPFFVPDIKTAVGRRVAGHTFPGLDISAYDDMGLHLERISFEALYVGGGASLGKCRSSSGASGAVADSIAVAVGCQCACRWSIF